MKEIIVNFLLKCGIPIKNLDDLRGVLIPRELLLSNKKYMEIKPEIKEIKKIFSSSSMTSLQHKAPINQKWPLLNLVRQILRACNYQMNPIRKAAGYTKEGKKLYKRYFQITEKDKKQEA